MDEIKNIIFGKDENKKKTRKTVKKEDKIIYNRRINVAGISNYYDVIKKIIVAGQKRGIYTKYKDMEIAFRIIPVVGWLFCR